MAEARRQGHACGGWSKQAALAKVVAAFTGVHVCKAEAEYIGNAQDYFLKDYVKQLKKAVKSESRAVCRARQAGRALSHTHGSRVCELKLQVYKCKFGGVPRNVVLLDGSKNPAGPAQPNEPVPWRTLHFAEMRSTSFCNSASLSCKSVLVSGSVRSVRTSQSTNFVSSC